MKRRYLCPVCGREGVVDKDMTLMDDRFAPGRCTIQHPGKGMKRLVLVRADVYPDGRPHGGGGTTAGHL